MSTVKTIHFLGKPLCCIALETAIVNPILHRGMHDLPSAIVFYKTTLKATYTWKFLTFPSFLFRMPPWRKITHGGGGYNNPPFYSAIRPGEVVRLQKIWENDSMEKKLKAYKNICFRGFLTRILVWPLTLVLMGKGEGAWL